MGGLAQGTQSETETSQPMQLTIAIHHRPHNCFVYSCLHHQLASRPNTATIAQLIRAQHVGSLWAARSKLTSLGPRSFQCRRLSGSSPLAARAGKGSGPQQEQQLVISSPQNETVKHCVKLRTSSKYR